MYCPKCGNSVNGGLKYCNTCGERLSVEEEDKNGTPGKMLDNVLTTLFLIVMFGMGTLVGLVAVLLGNDVPTEFVGLLSIVYLATIFGICFSLVRQVPKLIDAKLNLLKPTLPAAEARPQLDQYREPAMSVTEHTTRTLDKVPRS
jgi:hypothetical protein